MSPTVYRIHTPRLVVRCWEPADAPQLMAAKNASKEHLLPWMPWALGEPSDLAANLALIRAWHAQFDTDQDYVYGIFDRETSAVVGGTGLHERIGKNAREIGYWVRVGSHQPGDRHRDGRGADQGRLRVHGAGSDGDSLRRAQCAECGHSPQAGLCARSDAAAARRSQSARRPTA